MKTQTILYRFLLATLSIALIIGCSKDRLNQLIAEKEDPVEIKDDIKTKTFLYNFNENLLKSLAPKTTVYEIRSSADMPVIGPKGTKLYIYNYNLRNANGTGVQYPYTVSLKELYTLKDMLLYDKPTTSFDKLLTTAGAINVIVTKNNQVLFPNSSFYPEIQVPSKKTLDKEMKLFYGILDNQERFTWAIASDTTTNQGREGETREGIFFFGKDAYTLIPSKFNWINCDKFASYEGAKTRIKVTSDFPELQKMLVFLVLPRINSVIRIHDGLSLEVPLAEEVKLVALAKTDKDEYYSYFTTFVTRVNSTHKIELKPTTEAEFLVALDSL